eukprot:g7381.t1
MIIQHPLTQNTPLRRLLLHTTHQDAKPRYLWRGSPHQAKLKFQTVAPLLPFIELLSDTNSMTRHLERFTRGEIFVERTQPISKLSAISQPPVPGPVIDRTTILKSANERSLVYAQSLWNYGVYNYIMTDPDLPIWYNLQHKGITPIRNITHLFLLLCPELGRKFGTDEDGFVGREYLFIHKGKVLTTIMEIVAISNLNSFF